MIYLDLYSNCSILYFKIRYQAFLFNGMKKKIPVFKPFVSARDNDNYFPMWDEKASYSGGG